MVCQDGYIQIISRGYIYEITGVNGKDFCSRQYLPYASGSGPNTGFVKKEWAGFVQEVPIDPNQSYFFSGWVKVNKAINVYAMARFYNWTEDRWAGWSLTSQSIGTVPDGETTNGWFFLYREIPHIPTSTNRALIGFWHGLINDPPDVVDSTFCVDDFVFGKIIK